MTKQEILDSFKDINEAYNNSAMLDNLSGMIDKLLETQREEIERLKGYINGFSKDAIIPIRCKNCKNKEKDGISEGFHYCNINGLQVTDDWYCADGEMKESRSRKADDTIPHFDDSTGRMSEL